MLFRASSCITSNVDCCAAAAAGVANDVAAAGDDKWTGFFDGFDGKV